MIFVILLAVAAGAILELSLSSYRLSKRNEIRAHARSLAESEMEIFYYKFQEFLITGQAVYASQIPGLFTALGSNVYACDNSDTPTTAGTPYAKIYQTSGDPLDPKNTDPNIKENNDWIVRRSITVSQINPEAANATDRYTILGIIPKTTKTGKFSYLVARIVVEPGPTNPLHGKVSVKIGRRMSYATASIFQYNVFAQGDLEFAPGGNTVIGGDIAANGSIYMGASSGGSLVVNGNIHYLTGNQFNTTDDGVTITYRKPGTLMPDGSVVTADSTTLSAPLFGTSQAAQVQTMTTAENLTGGLDAPSIAQTYPELFGPLDPDTQLPTDDGINNVYRSLIAPPPNAVAAALGSSHDTASSEYPSTTNLTTTTDNDSIAALRAYNRAGLIITVGPSGNISSIVGNNGVDYTLAIAAAVTHPTATSLTPFYDQREGKNVDITEINIGTLKTAIDALAVGPTPFNFNGLLYVYMANSNPSNPAAVRLTNGATTPGSATSSGFSVVTNGGLYVKGDYNTTTSDGTSATSANSSSNPPTYTGTINPTMLMADSVTVLSNSWSDANSRANGTTDTNSAIDRRSAASGTTTINAGILTGNVASVVGSGSTPATASGGGQNLVRFLEDWTGKSVFFQGALGRLFNSRDFTGGYQQPGNVYKQPTLRTFAFNSGLKTSTIPGQPLIPYFSRGDFFTW